MNRILALSATLLCSSIPAQSGMIIAYRGELSTDPPLTSHFNVNGANFIWQGKFEDIAAPVQTSGSQTFSVFSGTTSLTIAGSSADDGIYHPVTSGFVEEYHFGSNDHDTILFNPFSLDGATFSLVNFELPLGFTGLASTPNTLTPISTADVVGFGEWRYNEDIPGTESAEYSIVNPSIISVVTGSDQTDQDLSNLDFSNFDLTGTNLTGTNLTKANLTGATLTGTTLTGANLTGANLTGTTLSGTILTGANLTGVNLTGTTLAGANLTGLNLSNQDFSDFDLTGTNFAGANLTGTDLTGADLTGTNLTGADLTGVKLAGANLTGQNLSNRDFSDFDLTGTNLTNTTLAGANLTGANLSGAIFIGADITGIDITVLNLKGANLSGLDLSDLDFSAVDLTGINLTGAKLINADLSGTDLTGANLTGADLTGADVAQTYLEFASKSEQEATATLNSQITALSETNATLQTELANRYTLAEIADLRPGSSMIAVSDGQATISLGIEESVDLVEWNEVSETTSVTLPASEGTKFFRFKMTE